MGSRPPDDALARLARWDELRRRAAGGQAAAPGPDPTVDPSAAANPSPVIDDVIATVRDLAERHPSLSLAVVAEDAGTVWRLHITRTSGRVQVLLDTDDAPGLAASTAAQLAELLRERPGILDERG